MDPVLLTPQLGEKQNISNAQILRTICKNLSVTKWLPAHKPTAKRLNRSKGRRMMSPWRHTSICHFGIFLNTWD